MNPRPRSELDLFHAITRDEDAKALEEFCNRLLRTVFWVLHRKNWRHLFGEAPDIMAESLGRLFRSASDFKGVPAEFRTYLYKTVVSACVDAANARRLTSALDEPVTLPDGEEMPLGEIGQVLVDPNPSPADEVEQAAINERVHRALERLDERCQRLIRQFHLEESPIAALARDEAARRNAIEVALSRCRKRFYAAVLFVFLDGSDADRKAQVTSAAQRLPDRLRAVFTPWWVDNRSTGQVAKTLGIARPEVQHLLDEAKRRVWHLITGGA